MNADGGSEAEVGKFEEEEEEEEEGARSDGFVEPFEVLIEGAEETDDESFLGLADLVSSADAVVVVVVGFDNPPSPARLIIPGTLPPFVVTRGSEGAEVEGKEEEELLVTGGT